ncbi:hypothetical protein SRABI06_01776 [Pseudomonas brassicacearum]|nr:hypothetical protein SRABI06_01776 [Pseudomonas brassicacearum]
MLTASAFDTKPLWERACSRRRRQGQHHHKLTHRFRERARSHRGLRVFTASGFDAKSLWERACSRRRRHIQHHHKLTLRYREQARSHRGIAGVHNTGHPYKILVGASLLAKTSAHPPSPQADPPLSRAGSLPQGDCGCSQHPDSTQNPCGSELAREGAGTSNITTSWPTAFASKLAPTGGLRVFTTPDTIQNPCGSEPAREDVGTSTITTS